MRVSVFAVEDTAIQVCWSGLRRASAELSAGSDSAVAVSGAAGAVMLGGLTPGSWVDVRVDGRRVGRVHTLRPPPGELLCRFATVNDMHIGARFFGTARPLWEDDPWDPHAVRCARAALAEAVAWGASAVVV